MEFSIEMSARGAPLCPVGHLPREGGDRSPRRFPTSFIVARNGESGNTADLPPRGGDVRQDREGRLALNAEGAS